MTGGPAWRLAMAAREPDQAGRLARFYDEHPGIYPRPAQFGTYEALLPDGNGGRVIAGDTLRELLEKLEQVFRASDSRSASLPPGYGPGAGDHPG